ncbi:putative DNA-binding protein [Rhodovulum imhoffii]|uniref:Putative DNA-binding protein n=1 Tax=Rhodovulum imhoffii TaxID=365340 RepID=A0A2T5BWD4_9RHOB|nr:DNA-binding domain-containing protein [Rhodovulum imhoffii]MBK5935127.1 hypothetical protein [Rhodovulum imhoffii]PTN03908.1 putative DNA-binding protein [Rhodovulum imhoffii]
MSHAFTLALLDPKRPVPPGLTDPQGRPAGKRFDIYRNNIISSLVRALETGFPVVRALVGEEFFAAMAAEFARAHPPRSPRLMFYGAQLPGFLERFPPVQGLPYLPDVARLELALRESYHAADTEPIRPEALAAIPAQNLPTAILRLAPSVRVLRAGWPVLRIWKAHQDQTDISDATHDVLICRPLFDPVPQALPPGGAAFVATLLEGAPLGAAVLAGEAEAPRFTPAPVLSRLLAGHALISVEPAP